jgi:methyl-accepting chemotaxis protein/methyl-accepting chemotaxis protein-1 (serine sensor receptor)
MAIIALLLLGLGLGAGVLWLVRQASAALKDLAAQMSESAERVSGAAHLVSGSSQSLASGASQQAASLEETSASTEEITSITRKNADHALQVAGLMQQSADGAVAVNQSLDRMVEQMKEIGNSSNKIARIIKVISQCWRLSRWPDVSANTGLRPHRPQPNQPDRMSEPGIRPSPSGWPCCQGA